MRNKGFVVFLTLLMTVLSIYYLSFTFVSQNIQKKADKWAEQNDSKAQVYLDSVWTEEVYSFLGVDYTYKEVKSQELNLGLDLKGGMHVTLEVSPEEIIRNMAGRTKDTSFFAALDQARAQRLEKQGKFTDFFYEAYKARRGEGALWTIFSSADNRENINQSTTDEEIMAMVNDEVDGAIDRAYEIIKNRIDRFGVAQPNIQKIQGTDRIQVELAGVNNPKRVRKLLQGMAKLEFFQAVGVNTMTKELEALRAYLKETEAVEEVGATEEDALNLENDAQPEEDPLADMLNAEEAPAESDSNPEVAEAEVADSNPSAEALEADSLAALDTTANQVEPLANYFYHIDQYAFYVRLQDTAKVNELLSRKEVQKIMPKNVKFFYSAKPLDNENLEEEVYQMYALKVGREGEPLMNGDVVTNANWRLSLEGSEWVVGMTMNAQGSRDWARVTGSVASDPDEMSRRIAIVLDGYVFSAPHVSGEITGGNSQIDGMKNQEEAKDLANVLNAGKLPAKLDIVQEAVVGPALGQEAIQRGLMSILVGLGLVIVFMVLYYNIGGIVANAALLVNLFFIFGVLAQFGTSLTLPGIAGIVLTVGMSIDANVLIFERVREELLKGKSSLNAIKDGYNRAFWTIFDANVTTLLTAIILAVFGSGPIRGFAVTLIVGIFCSFFAAVFVTRVIIEWFAKRNENKPLSFTTIISKNIFKGFNWDIIGKRKIAYGLSGIIIVAGLALSFTNGLNLGVDFKGGRSYIVRLNTPQAASDIRAELQDDFGDLAPEVKTFNRENQYKITTSYMIEDESSEMDSTMEMSLLAGLNKSFPSDSAKVMGSEKVGATIAQDIKEASETAVIFSLIAIFLYILMRFQRWQFGLGALVALFHDVLIVMAFYAFAGLAGIRYEVDQIFIAAMLTIIGYSINDTVVVFDRVKEYIREHPSAKFATILNDSINATFSRTFITSLTTLLVVAILLAFGGEVLAGFAYALLVGIIAGTYSSVFIATPLVLDLSKKGDIKSRMADDAKEKQKLQDGVRA